MKGRRGKRRMGVKDRQGDERKSTPLTHTVCLLPIPEEPRKRNTRGWSSSAQPISRRRIAVKPTNIMRQSCDWFSWQLTCCSRGDGSLLAYNMLPEAILQWKSATLLKSFTPPLLLHLARRMITPRLSGKTSIFKPSFPHPFKMFTHTSINVEEQTDL